jgi:hypothetical protein
MPNLHLDKLDPKFLVHSELNWTSTSNFKPHRGSPKNHPPFLIFNRHQGINFKRDRGSTSSRTRGSISSHTRGQVLPGATSNGTRGQVIPGGNFFDPQVEKSEVRNGQ